METFIKKAVARQAARKKMACVLALAGVCVAACVWWALHYTGIAVTNETDCGLAEHTHTETCYEMVLTCGFDAEASQALSAEDALADELISAEAADEETLADDEVDNDAIASEFTDDEAVEEEVLAEAAEDEPDEEALAEDEPDASQHEHSSECYSQVLICSLEEHTHSAECLVQEVLSDTIEVASLDEAALEVDDADEPATLSIAATEDATLTAGTFSSASSFTLTLGSTQQSSLSCSIMYSGHGNSETLALTCASGTTTGNTISIADVCDTCIQADAKSYIYLYTAVTGTSGGSSTTTGSVYATVTAIAKTSSGYTVTYGGNYDTVEYTSISGITFYYTDGTSDNELSASSYNSYALVYWDTYTDGGGCNSKTGISSVQMFPTGSATAYDVNHENSTATSYSASSKTLATLTGQTTDGKVSSDSKSTDVTLVITPQTGYYLSEVLIACACDGTTDHTSGSSNRATARTPYACSTWGSRNQYAIEVDLDLSGTATIELSSLYFSHSGDDENYYFILLKTVQLPNSLYVEYNYGAIVEYGASTTVFDDASAWLQESDNNEYGDASESDGQSDGKTGTKTNYTQYKYGYQTDPADVGNWEHYTCTITAAAHNAAADVKYRFVGWAVEYYTDVAVTENGNEVSYTASGEVYSTGYTWIYDFSNLYYTTSITTDGSEESAVPLYTHVELTALWVYDDSVEKVEDSSDTLTGYTLPNTGSFGIAPFEIAGAALIAGSLGLLVVARRRGRSERNRTKK